MAIAICCSLSVREATAAEQAAAVVEPFVLDSTESTYPFVMRLEGVTRRTQTQLVIDVTSGLIRSTIPGSYGEEGRVHKVEISFGLGRDDKTSWQMDNFSETREISADLAANETLPVGPHRFTISGIDKVALADLWLAAQLSVDEKIPGMPPGRLNSMACSWSNILGDTPKSKDRAKRMKANYSHAC